MPPKTVLVDPSVLIAEIKRRPLLWDKTHECYNVKYYSRAAWEQISKKLRTPEAVLRNKWKNLRCIFLREMRRNGAKTVEDYNGPWQYFDSMTFIYENIHVATEDRAEGNEIEETKSKEENSDNDSVGTQPYNDESNISTNNIEEAMPKKQKLNEEYYDIMFLRSLVPYFQDLDPIKKLNMRSKIQDLLQSEIVIQNSIEEFRYNK